MFGLHKPALLVGLPRWRDKSVIDLAESRHCQLHVTFALGATNPHQGVPQRKCSQSRRGMNPQVLINLTSLCCRGPSALRFGSLTCPSSSLLSWTHSSAWTPDTIVNSKGKECVVETDAFENQHLDSSQTHEDSVVRHLTTQLQVGPRLII